jgi:hypothetical protein
MDVDTNVIVPVNILPLLDDTDFKTIETAVVYNSAGLVITWNFVTTAGVVTGTAVTPTTGGNYDWSEPLADKGMYAMEIIATGGASANNDTEGVGWITGVATGVLPWRGPTIGFRRKALNDLLVAGSTASTNLEDFFDGTGYVGGTARLKVDVDTVKTQAVTCAAGVTVLASVGTAATSTAQTGDSFPLVSTEVAEIYAAVITNAAGVDIAADIIAVKGVVDTIQADTDLLDDAIGGLADIHTDVAAVKADTTAILLDTGTDGVVLPQAQADKVWGTAARILTANTNFNDPTAAAIADAVWDELVTGHDGVGKAGAQLWTDIDAIAIDVAGLDGAAMRGTDSAALASVCTEGRLSELDAITAGKMAYVADVIAVDVAGLDGAAMRGTDSAALASVCTEARLAELDAANLPTDVAARATPAQVNAEVLDVLNVDTFAEPGQEAPAATNTLVKKIGYLFKFLRNRVTQNATTLSVYADDAITVDQKATVSDDATTYDRGEIGSGP